jgi:hypothetical protein
MYLACTKTVWPEIFMQIDQTQECAWADVIRLFLTCHQANQGCLLHSVQEVRGGILCNDPLYQF